MRNYRFALVLWALIVAWPSLAHSQASITGVVRDASGAVLPGVTVEASSPALIERVRTSVTDGTGQYRIENLRPGAYTVTFTLNGSTVLSQSNVYGPTWQRPQSILPARFAKVGLQLAF